LEPSRAGYHLLVGRFLLALGNNEEAAKQASFVAERWHGPDRDEALELWSSIPAEKCPPDTSLPMDIVAGTQTLQGTLVSVTCGGKEGTSLVLQNSDGTLTFRSSGTQMVGYSDTLWFGTDHFTLCHHLDGLRAIVHYKPSADKQLAGEWLSWSSVKICQRPPPSAARRPTKATPRPLARQINCPKRCPSLALRFLARGKKLLVHVS